MIVSIHQPAYLPWLGYFDRIAKSDLFIFLDTVQFEKNSFTNRNRIKTHNGSQWLTVPVKLQGHLEKTMLEIEIDESKNWRQKHLRSIEQNYRRAPYFDDLYPRFTEQLQSDTHILAELCHEQLLFWVGELGISTEIVRASELPILGSKSDLVLSLCTEVGASHYISGPQGKDYLDEAAFRDVDIEVSYHDYKHPVYKQLHGDFAPNMAVLDYWMNCRETEIFQGNKTRKHKMNFSDDWDKCYRDNTHMSVWPWSDLVSLVMRYSKPGKPGLRVLELGCGAGANIPFFKSLEVDYSAIEGSETIVRKLHERYPEWRDTIGVGDFTKALPTGPFDLIVDRASLTCNNEASIRNCLAQCHERLATGGKFIGVDWYSTKYSDYRKGEQAEDVWTRTGFEDGGFAGTGRVHFSDKDHLLELFHDFELVHLRHKTSTSEIPDDGWEFAAWDLVAIKP